MEIKAAINRLSVTVRTGLIRKVRQEVVRKFFLDSQNAVVRATAFCAGINSDTTLRQLAAAMLIDCLKGGRINEPAARVYLDHFQKYYCLDRHERKELAVVLLEAALASDEGTLSGPASELIKYFDLC